MDDAYPVEEEIFILKKGRKLGPFEIDELLDALEEGEFSYEDICLRAGATECERLKDVLDWGKSDHSIPRRARTRSRESGSISPAGPPYETESDNPVSDARTLLYAGHPSIMSSPLALFCLIAGVTGGIWLFPIDPRSPPPESGSRSSVWFILVS